MNNENKNPNVEEELKKQSQEAAENEQTTSEASEAQENASSEEKELTAEEKLGKELEEAQKVIDEQDEKRRKATLQASYNVRMLLQAVWIIVSIGAPCFQPFASVLPLLFPRVTIYYLQITGKYKPLAPAGPSVDVSVEDDPEPAPEPEAEPRDEGGET